MTTRVRSHAKINLGLAIGPVRPDGYHALATVYQTLAVHEFVEVTGVRLAGSGQSRIEIVCDDPHVPCDRRNTCWQMVDRALARLGIAAQVTVRIEKRLPVQGGLGAGSANAAATLLGLEKELGVSLPIEDRLALAAEVGSDVPLFLIGGTVLGFGRGEEVSPLPDLPETPCVLAVPQVRVSTPEAFRDWDERQGTGSRQRTGFREQGTENPHKPKEGFHPSVQSSRAGDPGLYGAPTLYGAPGNDELTGEPASDRLKQLGRTWAAALATSPQKQNGNETGVFSSGKDRAENLLLELVRAGIRNDFETVVFHRYPSLHGILETLKSGSQTEGPAIYEALSGSGSVLFGLYRTVAEASAVAKRLRDQGIEAIETGTMDREAYWRDMLNPGLRNETWGTQI